MPAQPTLTDGSTSTAQNSYLNGMACYTPTKCIAVGYSELKDSGAVVQIDNGVAGSPIQVGSDKGQGNIGLVGVACATSSQCVATGYSLTVDSKGNVGEEAALVPISNGVPGSPVYPSSPPLGPIACPTVSSCIAVGVVANGNTESGVAYAVDPSTLSVALLASIPYSGAIGCTPPVGSGLAVCLVGGITSATSSTDDNVLSVFYGDRFVGTISAPVSGRRFEGADIRGISCPSVNLCEASAGGDGNVGGYFPISISTTETKGSEQVTATAGKLQPVPGTAALATVACSDGELGCVLGGWIGSGSSVEGAIVGLDPATGKLGAAVDIPGMGGILGASLPPAVTVNTTKDGAATQDVCASNSGECSLRAAIHYINGGGKGDEVFLGSTASGAGIYSIPTTASAITFNIVGATGAPSIALDSSLPPITAPVTIDGASQPGTPDGQPGVQIDGSSAGKDANGLELDGSGSSVNGLIVTGFGRDGILLKGGKSTVTRSWIGVAPKFGGGYQVGANGVGIEVASSNDVIGGTTAADRDVISGNGDASGLQSFMDSLKDKHETPAQVGTQMLPFGSGVLVRQSDVSNLTVEGDYIGLAPDGTDLPVNKGNAVGIAISSSGSASNITIGSNPGGNVITGNTVGVLALAPPYNALSGVRIEGNLIGDLPNGTPTANPVGNEFGVFTAGNIASLVVGASGGGFGNTFAGDMVGLNIAGDKGPKIQSDAFGTDAPESQIALSGKQPVLGMHDVAGALLLDTIGATFGGGGAGGGDVASGSCGVANDSCVQPGGETASGLEGTVAGVVGGQASGPNAYAGNSGVGNSLLGVPLGLLIAGDGNGSSSGNTVEGNIIGRQHDLKDSIKSEAGSGFPDAGSVIGLTIVGSSGNTIADNSVIGSIGGIITSDSPSNTFEWNILSSDGVGLLALGGNAGDHIGGTGNQPDDGNIFVRDAIGMALADHYPTNQVVTDAGAKSGDFQASQFDAPLASSSLQGDLDIADAVSQEQVGPATLDPKPAPGSGYVIDDNGFGTDGTGTKGLGDLVGAMIIGNVTRGQFAGNIVADNRQGGLWVGTVEGHSNSLAVYGDSFYNNSVGDSSSKESLGLDLWTIGLKGHELGPDQPSPQQPGIGANHLQNYPMLTKVQATSSGGLTIAGTLDSAPNTQYRIDLYSNTSCNPSGYGEGGLLLGTVGVKTGPKGKGDFTTSVGPAKSPVSRSSEPRDVIVRGKFVSATATDLLQTGSSPPFRHRPRDVIIKSNLDATSEFSQCLPVPPVKA
ncbi:MAG TPA: hypothetical protein VFB34_08365 [Chloroflexota bacterium]|nr:hypothetical protein [Chloroflexota bacterium]